MAKGKGTALAVIEKPYGEVVTMNTGGRGFGKVEAKDILIPRLEIVQGLSPVGQKSDPLYIKGIEQGDLYNTVTSERYGEEVRIIPLFFFSQFLIWLDRDKAKGSTFRGAFNEPDEAKEAVEDLPDEERAIAEVVDTPQYFVLVCPTGPGPDDEPLKNSIAVMAMPRSKFKVHKRFMATLSMFGGDIFDHAFTASTFQDQNAKGDKFYNYVLKPAAKVSPDSELYQLCETQYELLEKMSKQGDLNVDRSEHRADEDPEATGQPTDI